jgi:hypothetical protein
MIRSIRAELVKLTRTRLVLVTGIITAVFAVAGTAVVVLTAEPATPSRGADSLFSIEALSTAGGGTAIFARISAMAAAFLLAVFVATVAGEFTRGTFRTMLLQQPARGRVLVGKMVAVTGFTVVVAVLGAALSWVTARALAPGQDIDVSQWTSTAALGQAVEDVGRMALFVVGYGVFGTVVGVLARSIPVGVGVALVWSGPIENIIGDSWSGAETYFPGLLLRQIVSPGSTEVATGQAMATVALYAVLALAVAGVAVRRRDVTS